MVIHLYREGDAQGGQFLNRLLLILPRQISVNAGRGYAIGFFQPHRFPYQFGVLSAVRGVYQTRHGIEVVFAGKWVDRVGSLPILRQVQAIVPGFAERFICNCGVPVGVLGAVFVVLVVVKVELVGVLGRNCRYQVIVVFVVGVPCDGGQVALAQVDIVQIPRLIQLEGHVSGFHHLKGDGVKAGALGVPIEWILGKDFLVALDVGGHGVGTVVPHRLVIHGLGRVDAAQLLNHRLGHRIERLVGGQGIEVRLLRQAGVDNGVGVRGFQPNRLSEFGTIVGGQRIGFLLGEGFGILIVLLGALDHLQRHRGVGGIVFVEVEHPLQAGGKVLGSHFRFLIAVHIDPLDPFAQLEGPGLSLILAAPLLRKAGSQCALGGRFQQAVDQLGQVFAVLRALTVQPVEGFQLSGQQLRNHQIGDVTLGSRAVSGRFPAAIFC